MISYLQFEIIVMINQFSERRKQNESSNFLKTTLILVIQTHKNGNEAFKQSWHDFIYSYFPLISYRKPSVIYCQEDEKKIKF